MTRKQFAIFVVVLLTLLSACSRKDKYEPFEPLSKQTVSPEREAAIQAALNGELPEPTEEIIMVLEPEEMNFSNISFDEDSFFAEVGPEPAPVEEIMPFEAEPPATATPIPPTPVPPTPTPLPTATKPYDPNINMYGTTNGLTTYTLQEGDSLVCLGRRFDISVTQLLAQNGIESPDEKGVGDTVIIPRSPKPWNLVDGYGRRMLVLHPAAYRIQSGDTLFSIACAYGDVLPEDLAVQNHLVLGEPLTAGTTINIP